MSADHLLLTRPLAATLGRLVVGPKDEGGDLSARFHGAEEPGWIPAAELVANRGLLEEALESIEQGCGVRDRAYVGTSLIRSYLWRILTTSVAAFLLERRVPDLRAENVSLRFGDGGFIEGLAFTSARFFTLADDPEAEHPDATVLPSEKDLLSRMREPIAQTHLQELIPTLRSLRVRRGTRVLWKLGTDAFAEAFMSVGQATGRETEALDAAEKLLEKPSPLSGSANYFALEYEGGSKPSRIRNTYCLHYKVAGSPCLTCPRTTDEERRERMAT